MKKTILVVTAFLISIFFLSLVVWTIIRGVSLYKAVSAESERNKARNEAIEAVIDAHRVEKAGDESSSDPFDGDEIVKVLLVGIDKRAGQTEGHCDAIQLIAIDKAKQNVTITAVPRGTYSPLPPGKGTTSSDYYVSNSCALGGLEYGIQQIEKILGQKADYLVVVGFSETLGILRNLQLPTTQTLQWLRQRHIYAIGEPQRARDHSTFLKYLLVKFVPNENSQISKALQYIIYKIVQTDLSFADTQILAEKLSAMDFANHPERIQLMMRPAFDVEDIQYVPEKLGEYLNTTLSPLKNILSKNDYSDASENETQAKLLAIIDEKKDDPGFVVWAFDHDLWLQIEDNEKRMLVQFDFLERYLSQTTAKEERESLISDYILEMENRGETQWVKKGRKLLEKEI